MTNLGLDSLLVTTVNLSFHYFLAEHIIFGMSTFTERKEQVATWNGDPTTWLDNVKRVRLQFERTERKKRHLLGAELASRLTGKAWDIVSAEINHADLQRRDGPAYLLRFLEERLSKAPVPDTGQRLEDLFVRLKRSPGMSMAEWATALRESYRRLQRAMARQRQDLEKRDGVAPQAKSRPASRAASHRSTDVTSPRAGGGSPGSRRSNPRRGEQDRPDDPRTDGYEPVPTVEGGNPDGAASEHAPSNNGDWTDERWREWRQWRYRHDADWSEDDWWHEDEIEWDQFDLSAEHILLQEILGWILLRRSGLPANAKLSVLSATNNRLDLDSMERAMRDQEEELLAAESNRLRLDHHRARRTFWVEQDSQWGIMQDPDNEEIDESAIMWIGDTLPPEVYSAAASEPTEQTAWSTWLPDGQELAWEWHDDDFYAQDAAGIFWSWSETKTWLDLQDAGATDQPLQEAFANFSDRFRTFKESRALNAARHVSRGFYPLAPLKGKYNKGKSKGKGKSKFGNKTGSSAPATTAPAALFNSGSSGSTGKGTQRPGNPEYRGCFICGSQDHDFRRCPKRQSGSASMVSSTTPNIYYAGDVFMVSGCGFSPLPPHESDVILGVSPDALAAMSMEFPGHAVLDSGATESIASLEALEEIMVIRSRTHGQEQVVVHQREKRFRFGNGTYQNAVSFVEVPQVINGHQVPLGVHALDAPGIPLLISVKTLTALKAILDFEHARICFKDAAPDVWIPLKRAPNGHLLLDLTQDWVPMSPGVGNCMIAAPEASKSDAQYKCAAAVAVDHVGTISGQEGVFQGHHISASSAISSVAAVQHVPHGMHEKFDNAKMFDEMAMPCSTRMQSTGEHEHVGDVVESAGNSGSNMRLTLPLLVAAAALTTTSSSSSPLIHGADLDSGCGIGSKGDFTATCTKGEDKDLNEEDKGGHTREVRPEPPNRPGRARLTGPGVSMLWQPYGNARGPRLSERAQRPWQVDSLFNLPTTPGVRAGIRRDRDPQTGRTTASRCRDGHECGEGRCEGKASCPRSSELQGSQHPRSRGFDAQQAGEVGERPQTGLDQGGEPPRAQDCTDTSYGRFDRRSADENCTWQEGSQAREREGGGGGRDKRVVNGVRSFAFTTQAMTDERNYEIADETAPEEIFYQASAILEESKRASFEAHGHDCINEINGKSMMSSSAPTPTWT